MKPAVAPPRADVEAARVLVKLVERRGGTPPEWVVNLASATLYSLPEDQREMFITFGVQYAHEPHPCGHEWVHPDGWLTVQYTVGADGLLASRERARTTVWQYLRGHYAFDYDVMDSSDRAYYYPRGELARLVLP